MKNRYRIILFLMTIGLTGIIIVQTFWIRHALRAESARFDQTVYAALNRAVTKLEKEETFFYLNNELDLPRPPKPDFDSLLRKGWSAHPQRHPRWNVIHKDSIGRRKSPAMYFSNPDSSHIVTIFNNGSIRTVTVQSEADSTMENINMDIYLSDEFEDSFLDDGIAKPDSEIVELDSLIVAAEAQIQFEREKIVKEKYELFNERMGRWVFEYNFPDDEYRFINEQQNLDTIIGIALRNSGITLPYYYQVVRELKDTTMVLKSSAASESVLSGRYKTELYPDNIFKNNIYVKVDFPGRTKHIYSSIYLLLAGSFIFTLIILLAFGMTLYFMQKQKKISDIKSDFINNMTHEFKTPIATISLATDTMSSPKILDDEKEIKHYLQIIRQENKRMNKQVEHVLQMALIENNNFQLDLRLTDAHQAIDNVIRAADVSIKKKEGRIVSILRARCSTIPLDEIHFANVMTNIIDNAIKYNENPPDILIETYNKNDLLYIRVSDNGIGMNREVQKHIFDKFYRKPEGNIHNVKGFGLGLSYVKAIVEAQGGTISVSSEPRNGSTFTLAFNC